MILAEKGGGSLSCKSTGLFLVQLRKEKNWTQLQLANQLGVTPAAVSKWERGLCYPDIQLVVKISSLFSVTVEELLAGQRMDELSSEDAGSGIVSYVGTVRRSISRKAIAVIAFVVVLSFFSVLLTLYFLREAPESSFFNQYYSYGAFYQSESVDIGQLLTQYNLNGDSCTLSTHILAEKDGGVFRDVHVLRSEQMEQKELPINYSVFCHLCEEDPSKFQVVFTLSAKKAGENHWTTDIEIYDVVYTEEGLYKIEKR